MPYEIYVDDGYSGLNFERPSFQRMIDDVAVGKIGVVVVKDLSRFGRDHIVVGQYQEIYFPSKKVRFIALNDGIDTVNSHTTDYAALKNVINEFYSRDTSRKIKAAFRARAKDGKYHAKAAPFGYLKDPNDHNHLIPDPETAPIVAKIYDLVLKGWGNYRIRDYLRETKVPVPSWYQHIRGVEDKSHMFPDEDSKYIWRPDTLRLLIRNRVYCGDCVLCKSDTIFKTKQHFKTDEKEWITVENTHEAIVSREIWERANELIAVKRREYRKTLTGDLNIFSGLLKCADCGKALSRRKYGSNSGHMIYVCGTYATYGSHKCTQHKIFEEDLTAAMLADIQELFSAVTKNKARLIDLLIKGKAKSEGKTLTTKETQYKRVCKRLEDVNRLISSCSPNHPITTTMLRRSPSRSHRSRWSATSGRSAIGRNTQRVSAAQSRRRSFCPVPTAIILSCRWLLFSARTTEQELPAEKSLKGSSFYVEELALLHSEIPVISEF